MSIISNNWQLCCLFTRLFRITRKKTSKLCISGPLWWEFTSDWWIPPQRTSNLTLNVRGPSYLSLTRSISWLLMPWLLMSPGHCRQDISSHDIDFIEYVGPGLMWGRILSTCVISKWNNDIKCNYMFLFHLKNLACKGLKGVSMSWCHHISIYYIWKLLLLYRCCVILPDFYCILNLNFQLIWVKK